MTDLNILCDLLLGLILPADCDFHWNHIRFLLETPDPWFISQANLIGQLVPIVLLFGGVLLPIDPPDHRFTDLAIFVVDWVEFPGLFVAFWKDHHAVCLVAHATMRGCDSEGWFLFGPTVFSLAHYIAQLSVAFHLKLYLSRIFNLQMRIIRVNHMLRQIRWCGLRIPNTNRRMKILIDPQHWLRPIQVHSLNVVWLFIWLSLHLCIVLPFIEGLFVHDHPLLLLVKGF